MKEGQTNKGNNRYTVILFHLPLWCCIYSLWEQEQIESSNGRRARKQNKRKIKRQKNIYSVYSTHTLVGQIKSNRLLTQSERQQPHNGRFRLNVTTEALLKKRIGRMDNI